MLMHVSGKPYSAVQQKSPRHHEVRRNLSQRSKGKQTPQPRQRPLGARLTEDVRRSHTSI